MLSIADSLVESYIYADMYNREYEGGNNGLTEKIYGAGLPVEYIIPSLKNTESKQNTYTVNNFGLESSDNVSYDGHAKNTPSYSFVAGGEQEGGQKCKGPFTNKVVPVGLVFIQVQRDHDLEYSDHFYPGENREVIPDSLYETLMGSVLISKKKDPVYNKKITPVKKRSVKDRSRKNK